MNDARHEYWRRMQALLTQRAVETRPLRIVPKRASGGYAICLHCRERMLEGAGSLHRGACGACRKHGQGNPAPPVTPYGNDAA